MASYSHGELQHSRAEIERIRTRAAAALARPHDAHIDEYNKYDPMFLAMGITVPKAKRPFVMEPARKAAAAKAWGQKMENHRRGRKLKDIVREQNIGQTAGWHGPRLVRG